MRGLVEEVRVLEEKAASQRKSLAEKDQQIMKLKSSFESEYIIIPH